MLVVLGESIIAMGVGANLVNGQPVTWQVLATVVLGITVIAALWRTYFDEPALFTAQACTISANAGHE